MALALIEFFQGGDRKIFRASRVNSRNTDYSRKLIFPPPLGKNPVSAPEATFLRVLLLLNRFVIKNVYLRVTTLAKQLTLDNM